MDAACQLVLPGGGFVSVINTTCQQEQQPVVKCCVWFHLVYDLVKYSGPGSIQSSCFSNRRLGTSTGPACVCRSSQCNHRPCLCVPRPAAEA
jgi:hypothetical protein